MSTFVPVLIATVCIALIVLLVNSTYGRSFKAIRDDEIAAEAMGINLAKHKMISFVTSSFFAGVAGATMAMVLGIAQASNFKSAMTYEILLMVVLGGIGSITGSVIGSVLFVAASEWWLRGLQFLRVRILLGNCSVKFMVSDSKCGGIIARNATTPSKNKI